VRASALEHVFIGFSLQAGDAQTKPTGSARVKVHKRNGVARESVNSRRDASTR
jgi:hypothetical protein